MELFIEHPIDGLKSVELNPYQRHITSEHMLPRKDSEVTSTKLYKFPRQQGITTGLVYKAIDLALDGQSVLFLSHNNDSKIEAQRKCEVILEHNDIEYTIERSIITFANGSELVFGGITNKEMRIKEGSVDPVIFVDSFDQMSDLQKDFIIEKLNEFKKLLVSTDDEVTRENDNIAMAINKQKGETP